MPLSAVVAQGDLLRSNPGGPGQGYVTRQGSRLIDPATNASFRFGGCNIYWMGLDENVGGVAHPTHFRITGSLTTPDEGVYFAIVNADSGTAVFAIGIWVSKMWADGQFPHVWQPGAYSRVLVLYG